MLIATLIFFITNHLYTATVMEIVSRLPNRPLSFLQTMSLVTLSFREGVGKQSFFTFGFWNVKNELQASIALTRWIGLLTKPTFIV